VVIAADRRPLLLFPGFRGKIGRATPRGSYIRGKRSFDLQIYCGGLAAVVLDLKFNVLAFIKRTKAGPLYCRNMDKHIPATTATCGLDEAIAFLRIEPFHCACGHRGLPEIAREKMPATAQHCVMGGFEFRRCLERSAHWGAKIKTRQSFEPQKMYSLALIGSMDLAARNRRSRLRSSRTWCESGTEVMPLPGLKRSEVFAPRK